MSAIHSKAAKGKFSFSKTVKSKVEVPSIQSQVPVVDAYLNKTLATTPGAESISFTTELTDGLAQAYETASATNSTILSVATIKLPDCIPQFTEVSLCLRLKDGKVGKYPQQFLRVKSGDYYQLLPERVVAYMFAHMQDIIEVMGDISAQATDLYKKHEVSDSVAAVPVATVPYQRKTAPDASKRARNEDYARVLHNEADEDDDIEEIEL
jgi:hypothetical protein